MGYYSEVNILTTCEGAVKLAEASALACENSGNPYPILSLDEKGGIVINGGEYARVNKNGRDVAVLTWPCIKWYSDYSGPSFADVDAIENGVRSGEFPAQLVRVGESYDDVECIGNDPYEMREALDCCLETNVTVSLD